MSSNYVPENMALIYVGKIPDNIQKLAETHFGDLKSGPNTSFVSFTSPSQHQAKVDIHLEGRSWFEYPQPAGAPGHEGWGRVVEIGEGVRGLREGDRVAALTYRAHAEFDIADADAIVTIPASLDRIPVPGEPLGCAFNIFQRSLIRPGQTVAIVGIGFLGALLTRLAAHAGARVIAVSRRPFALGIARALGASETIVMDEHRRIVAEVERLTHGRGCECVIEAVGLQWPLDLAGELTGERGRLVIAGYHQDGTRNVNMQLWNWRGIDVINAHERDPQTYVKAFAAPST